ncbi:MAG: SAM-dependent methyltransferase [Clostridia bacterium]|nr:SAM-dependent methyltransferase [Loktanella sp.]MBQ1950973.1 SAM-dependent methyltransferase [Clostridia bacterium]
MHKLDKRLACVASLVRSGRRLADIGTDHAHLPVYLVESGVCPSAIASDIGAGPLETARQTVCAAGLQERIDLRLGDGLSTLAPGEAEDIVIAGMGGETIVEILEKAEFVRNAQVQLVLQPMSHAEDLRRWLLTHGFEVTCERLVMDGRHMYPVLAATYAAAPPSADELPYYAGFFEPTEGRPYRRMMAAHLRRRAAGVTRRGEADAVRRWLDLADALDKM